MSCRALIKNSSDMFALVDSTGEVVYASSYSRKVFGYLPEELFGRNTFEFLHPDDREDLRGALREVFANPPCYRRLAARVREKNGRWRCVESNISSVNESDIVAIVLNGSEIGVMSAE